MQNSMFRFFRMSFYRKDGSGTETLSEVEIARAGAADSLLTQFKSVPGEDAGNIDIVALQSWITEVRKLAALAKRSAIADTYIGQILAHSPPESGVWPPTPVCSVLEDLSSAEIESGLRNKRFNMCGTMIKAMFEGGDQERRLAKDHRKWSEARREYPRTASLLGKIAGEWDQEAKRHSGEG
ncbi:hypothetical protein [Bradyrhizobium sp.]|jgi:hypothetical protein|uniref:hypothetical protein n=2 Tax=Nitrobacteraceae TaxID=41294 RepID=UPI003919CAEA